jgi:hypothetical protein
MQQLTALTQLGLEPSRIRYVRRGHGCSSRMAVSQALAAPPLLASLEVINFRLIGWTLGAALERLRLTIP